MVVGAGLWVLASAFAAIVDSRNSTTLDDVMQVTGPILGVAFVVAGLGALSTALLALAFGVFGVLFLLSELLLPH